MNSRNLHGADQYRLARGGLRLLLRFAICVFVVTVTLGLDMLIGEIRHTSGGTDRLVFPPNQYIVYDMLEFKFGIRTNNLGFRGAHVDPAERPAYRILGVGDSYTLGWGVKSEETWLQVLERQLLEKGVDAEVLNLGRLGGDEADFLPLVQRALPLLKPDMVILALPQRTEIAAMTPVSTAEQVRTLLQRWRYRWYPNITVWIDGARAPAPAESPVVQANRLKPRQPLSEPQRERLASVDERLPAAYDSGKLPPALMYLLTASPGKPLGQGAVLDPAPEQLDAEIAELVARIKPIKTECDAFAVQLVVFAYPVPMFCSAEIIAMYEKLGIEVSEELLSTDTPDRIVREACRKLGIPNVSVTQTFRETEVPLFYPLDGHPTPLGHERIAGGLLAPIEGLIRGR